MYLTKQQIESIINKVGQPEASVILNRLFNEYRTHLTSKDVASLYDPIYYERLNNHPNHDLINGNFKINIYNKSSYEYLLSKINTNTQLLDLGCGEGDFALALAAQNIKLAVGIDFSENSAMKASKRAEEANLPCKFFRGDFSSLSLDSKFDFITLNDVTEHLSDMELKSLFREIKILLKPEGEILIHTPNGLALCNETDSNWLSKSYKSYLIIFKGWKGLERTAEQIFYDQVHINIKSYRQIKSFLQECRIRSTVHYDDNDLNSFFPSLSSNMMVIGKFI